MHHEHSKILQNFWLNWVYFADTALYYKIYFFKWKKKEKKIFN